VGEPIDEFKDAGTYFDEGRWVELPGFDLSGNFTIMGWFIWLSGPGPLFLSESGELKVAFEDAGNLAYTLADAARRTSCAVGDLRGHWILVAIGRSAQTVTLRIDSGIVDHWDSAPPLSPGVTKLFVMKDAVGFAADVAYWDGYVEDAKMHKLWIAGKGRV
jgi:hypothetical protein